MKRKASTSQMRRLTKKNKKSDLEERFALYSVSDIRKKFKRMEITFDPMASKTELLRLVNKHAKYIRK